MSVVEFDPAAVEHPRHYNSHPSGVETWEINEWLEANTACTFKYVMRRGDKGNPIQDLEKGIRYLEREIQRVHKFKQLWPFTWNIMTVNQRFDREISPTLDTLHEAVDKLISAEENAHACEFYCLLLRCMDLPTYEESLHQMIEQVRNLISDYRVDAA